MRSIFVLVAITVGVSVGSLACGGAGSGDASDNASADLSTSPLPPPPPTDAGTKPPPPPPPLPASCIGGGFASANGVCSKDVDLLVSAEAACVKSGLLLKTFAPDESCGSGASNGASYECCGAVPPPPPPPPPPTCTTGGFANANGACSSDATMQASAQASCTKQGLTLVSFTGDEKCGKGSSSSGTYTCCSAAVLPAEPPTPAAP